MIYCNLIWLTWSWVYLLFHWHWGRQQVARFSNTKPPGLSLRKLTHSKYTGPRSTVCNVSGNRCESDCRSRGRELNPSPVPFFRGDRSLNNFYGHSLPFRWIIQQGLLSVTSEIMYTKYWLTACSEFPRKSVLRWTDCPAMTIAVDLGCEATKQTNKIIWGISFSAVAEW